MSCREVKVPDSTGSKGQIDSAGIEPRVLIWLFDPVRSGPFRPGHFASLVRTLSSTFMKLMYESYGESYGLKYLCTSPSAKYFVHM